VKALRVRVPWFLPVFAVACANADVVQTELSARTVIGFSTEGYPSTASVNHVRLRVTHGSNVQTTEVDVPTQRTELTVLGEGSVTVELEGYAGASSDPSALRWIQRASSPLNRDKSSVRLLRMGFDPLCVSDAEPSVLRCGKEETCARGVCISMARSSLELESYTPSWFVAAADPCRPSAGLPEVEIGAGAAGYTKLLDGATLALEAGPQGGHHLWIGAKGKNFAQQGTLVAITGRNPDTGMVASPATFVFSLNADSDGRCSVTGLRYQVDAGGLNYRSFLGAPFELTVEMRDRFGTISSATTRVQIDK
jgi:hypothetical protein